MSDMKCPACSEKLTPCEADVAMYACENQYCNSSIHYRDLVGSKELWHKAIVGYAVIDVALKELRKYAHGEYTLDRAIATVRKIEEMLKKGVCDE